jgi:eukaryotic-like serine/threonine-protein kinase
VSCADPSQPGKRQHYPPVAYRLNGQQLENGWIVGQLQWEPDDEHCSGGSSSAQYVVSRGGDRAFLKALDLSYARKFPNPAQAASDALKAFAFEVQLLQACRRRSRVVTILDSGLHTPDPQESAFFVPYLIFELADYDVRRYLTKHDADVAWKLRAAHQLAVAMNQLHSSNIIHQDLKASNALVFLSEGCKIGDLGSACVLGDGYNQSDRVGTKNYAPPEVWYGAPLDVSALRSGDLFLLGSVFVYMLTQLPMRVLLMERHLPKAQQPPPGGLWAGTYDAVLPYLQHAMGLALEEIYAHLPTVSDRAYDYRSELIEVIRALCNPNFRGRGFRQRDGAVTLSLEQGISKLNRLARLTEVRARLRNAG